MSIDNSAFNSRFIQPAIKTMTYALLLIFTSLILYPIIYAVFGSFKSTQEFMVGGLNMIPQKWIVQNYIDAFTIGKFDIYTKNSIMFSSFSVIGVLFTCSMSGYLLSRSKFFGRKVILGSFVASMFLTGSVTIYPVFLLCRDLGLLNSIAGMVIVEVAWAQPMFSILIMGYCSDIPRSLDESAKIEGCGVFRIYWNIMLPIIRPIIATVALLQFRAAWNAYMLPLAFTLANFKLRTLAVGVVSLKDTGEGISAWNLMLAGSVISIVPIILLFVMLSKFFIAGLTAGAVKG